MLSILLALLPLTQPQGGSESQTYRQLFDAGLAAFEAREMQRASALFARAGERAPSAPLWRVYCAAAQEAAGEHPEVQAPPGIQEVLQAWGPVPVLVMGGASGPCCNGDRLLYGSPEAALVDARSDALVARLRFQLPTLPSHPQTPAAAPGASIPVARSWWGRCPTPGGAGASTCEMRSRAAPLR